MDSGTRRLSDGDHAAFRDLFQKFYSPLLGFFIKRGCPSTQAEDFVQETLMNAYRGFATFRGDASATTWIFAIAGNVWLNHQRDGSTQKRAVKAVSLEELDSSEVDGSGEAHSTADRPALDRILQEERRRRLRSAVEELPTGRRTALQLHLLHGLKYKEIANVLSVEVNTVKSHIAQAKKQLRQLIGPEPAEAGEEDAP
ncbi:MAG: sigma-70 family RNA polymerase sigma factor [Acidobacteriota bacterium]